MLVPWLVGALPAVSASAASATPAAGNTSRPLSSLVSFSSHPASAPGNLHVTGTAYGRVSVSVPLSSFVSAGGPAETLSFFRPKTEFHLALGLTALPETNGSSYATGIDVEVDTRRRMEPYCESAIIVAGFDVASAASIGRAARLHVTSFSTTSSLGAGPAASIAVCLLVHKFKGVAGYGHRHGFRCNVHVGLITLCNALGVMGGFVGVIRGPPSMFGCSLITFDSQASQTTLGHVVA